LHEHRAYIDAEAEVIHMILSGIRDEIYSTVDACKTAQEMWTTIKRLQQGESLNKQDVKTNQFWEFGKFTSRDGVSIESNYSRFYKMMNEMTTSSRHTSSTSSYAPTRNKGKEVAKPRTPPSLSVSEEDSDLEQAQQDKDMQKSITLTTKYLTKIYKPTNNNLITSSNFINKNVDYTPRTRNDRQTGQFGNQRTVTIAEARETVKGYSYRKENMMLRKQEEKGVPLSAEQSGWLHDTDEEPDEQELEAQYMYMAKIQEVLQVTDDNFRPTYDTKPLEQIKQKEVEDHRRISSISNKTKCVFNSIHDAYVSKILNDMNARSKKPQVVPIRHRKPIRKLNQSVATPPKKIVASDPTIRKSRSYYRMLYEKTSKV
ncbi:hypothetical protein Tco_1267251, partial [Tanacetum coccineum]